METLDAFVLPMVSAVRAAARVCRTVQGELDTAGTVNKDDRSPVTVADLAGQAIVAGRIAKAFPGIPLVGEEDSGPLRESAELCGKVLARVQTEWADCDEAALLEAIDRGSAPGGPTGRFFTLDPIDGTKGFLRGDHYAVAFALVEDGEPVVGVLGCPRMTAPDGSEGLVLVAVRDKGVTALAQDSDALGGVAAHVSDVSDTSGIRRCESVEAAHSAHGDAARISEALAITAEPVRIDSQAKYGVVGTGLGELYMRIPTIPTRKEKIWDHAAGAIVVTEAGGTVTDLDGKPLDFGHGTTLAENRGIIASNGHVHDAVLAAFAG